jgi:uncharacterized protein
MNTTTSTANPIEVVLERAEQIVPVSPWIWPGILIAGPAAVVLACMITAAFVVQHPEALVASDYYKQGKAINAQLSQLSHAESLGLSTMTVAATDTMFTVRFPDAKARGSMNAPERIEIILAHPVDASRDLRALASPSASGAYEISLPRKLVERRRIIVTNSPARSWRVETLFIPSKRSREAGPQT